jgi:Holliday junction resolvase
MTDSRAKGARGERELALFLTDAGFPAKRGVQFSQGKHGLTGADVLCEALDFMHIECKRVEKLSLYEALSQALRDAGSKIATDWHKKNNHEWVVIIRAEDFLDIIRRSDLVDQADYKKAIETI